MKLGKKSCRMAAKTQFLIPKNNGMLHMDHITHIVRVGFQNISGKRVMLLYFCPTANADNGNLKPQFVVYQAKDDYLTLEFFDNGKTRWRTAQTDALTGYYRSFLGRCAFYSHREEEMVMRFCKNDRPSGFSALAYLQRKIFNIKCEERKLEKNQKVRNRMLQVKPLPEKSLKKWAHWEVLPGYIVYTYQKGKKKLKGFCTHCQKDVLVSSVRHGKQCICPSCGYAVTARAAGRKTNIHDRTTIQYLQKYGDEVLLRICKVSAHYKDYRNPTITVWETIRIFLSAKEKNLQEESYYYSYEGQGRIPWVKGSRSVYNHCFCNFEADTCGHIYTKNLERELKGTPWQYAQLAAFYLSDRIPMCIRPYFREYLRHPVLEYLVKLRLYSLATYAVYGDDGDGIYPSPINMNGANMKEVLGVDRRYIPMMQQIDMNRRTLRLLKQLIKDGMNPSADLMAWCQENKVWDADDLSLCFKHMTPGKMIRYLSEQCKAAPEEYTRPSYYGQTQERCAFDLYKDYIRFAEDLHYDLTDDFVVFPRHVKDAHDRVYEMFDKRRAEIYNEKIAAQHDILMAQYQMAKLGLVIVPPKTAAEIVEEGQKLHHCVGGYVSRVAKNECTILFLRKEDQPDTPFYTMEVRDGEVKQLRGDRNCSPTPEVDAYLNLWKQEKLLPAVAQAA